MRLVQGMYANARSRVRVGEFEVKACVHQGSVLSLMLFIVIIAESIEECVRRLLTWKEAMEEKGLRVNAGKTKIMICGMGLDLLQSSGKFPCTIYCTGVGKNSIFCNGCKH